MKSIIKNVALILDDKQSFSYLDDTTNQLEPNATISTYVALANFVLRDIASNFLCYKTKEKLLSNAECKIMLSGLIHQPCTIKKVINFFGKNIAYKTMIDCLVVPSANEQYEIDYTYYPDDVDLDDDVELPVGLDKTTICYGIVCEYYRLKMMFAEADIWEEKYKKGLRILLKYYSDKFFLFRGL